MPRKALFASVYDFAVLLGGSKQSMDGRVHRETFLCIVANAYGGA